LPNKVKIREDGPNVTLKVGAAGAVELAIVGFRAEIEMIPFDRKHV